jgi:hypothetical protein
MSKFLNVPNGDYKVKVQEGGEITLDTGINVGQVRITGSLIVEGDTTIVESETMAVKDNIIVINDGETGVGISLNEGGLRIDRGSLSDAFLVFDEDITWRDPTTETTKTGGFVFKNEASTLVGIRANSISTGGGDLYLINSGTGVISVTGTTDYEDQVAAGDDDVIPNKAYVNNRINEVLTVFDPTRILDGSITPSYIRVLDQESTSSASIINIAIDDTVVGYVNSTDVKLHDIKIIGSTIQTVNSFDNLVLAAPGTGIVQISDTLQLDGLPTADDVTTQPLAPSTGAKIYTNDQSTGGTGIYFVNAEDTRDEIISNNRALLYSMIF